MINSNSLGKTFLSFFAVAILLFTVSNLSAQTNPVEKKRLKVPSTVKGVIGGESHDGFVIRLRKNQRLKVQISWSERGDHTAHFVISKSPDFYTGDVLEGGIETYSGKTRTVKIPTTGDYYIYVTAHPIANYTLKVSVK